jgi:uncharacterized membrane protein
MFKKIILPYIIILVLFLIIDIPMIMYINNPMYKKQFDRINKDSSIKMSSLRIYSSAIFAYLLLALGIYIFIVRPEIENPKQNYVNIMIKGMILGLIIYGIYNGTNMATIKEWGLKEFIVDTVWGTTLSGILGVGSIYLVRLYIK